MTENMSGSVAKDGKLNMEDAVEIYQKVLEDLVQVNSLFTTAVFLGISFRGRTARPTGVLLRGELLVFEVIAFGYYLLSSLVAKALKVHLTTYLILKTKLFRKALVTVLFFLFLALSMVNIIQIRLEKMSCEGLLAGSLIAIVSLALLIYVACMMRTMVSFFRKGE